MTIEPTGEIQKKRLEEISTLNPSRPKQLLIADDVPITFVPMTAVSGETGEIDQIESRPYGEVKKGYTYFEESDVLFAKISPCMDNGKHAVVRNTIKGIGFGSTEFHVIRPSEIVRSDWIHLYLRQPHILQEASKHYTGAVGQQRVPLSFLKDLTVPVPDLKMQDDSIALIHEALSIRQVGLIRARERQNGCAALIPSLFREVFGSINPVSTDGRQESDKDGWDWKRLTKIARLESGHTPSRRVEEWWGGDIPWIALPDIRALDGKIATTTSRNTNPLGIANSAARVLPPGTVVFCRDVVVGYVTIMGVEMATSQHFANWICGPDLDPEFLMYALMASREYLQEIASGSVHQTIYMPALESFHIMAPPVDEQKRIAQWLKSALAEADAIREHCDTELKAIEAIPSALLRRVFGDPAN